MILNLWDFLTTRWWGQLIYALLCWAITALFYWQIGRHGYVPVSWLGLIIYSMLGKWGWFGVTSERCSHSSAAGILQSGFVTARATMSRHRQR